MAFDLPRSPRSLRFAEEVRSLAEERTGPPPPPSSRLAQQRPRTVRGQPHTPLPPRAPLPSFDDENVETLCLDRNALAIAQLPDARQQLQLPTPPYPGPQLPVPHFRSVEDVLRQQQAAQAFSPPPRGGPFPLAVWLCAALVAAVVSFFVAPAARALF